MSRRCVTSGRSWVSKARRGAILVRPRSANKRPGAGRQRLPGEDGMDGFFYARIEKATL